MIDRQRKRTRMVKGLHGLRDSFLGDLHKIKERLATAQTQVATGKRILKASDAPQDLMLLLDLRAALARNNQSEQNLGRVKNEVDTGENVLSQAVKLMERANAIVASASGTLSEKLPLKGAEVKLLHEHMVALSRTAVEGRFIFSGDTDQIGMYEPDWTQPGGVTPAQPGANTRKIMDADGATFLVGRSAAEIFDARDPVTNAPLEENLFVAVRALGDALEQDDRAAVEAIGSAIKSAAEHLGRQLAFYGNVQKRVEFAINAVNQREIKLSDELSGVEDADLPAAMTAFNLAETHLNAALTVHGRMPRTSLFDFLG